MTDDSASNGNNEVSRAPIERTVTWPVKDGDALIGTVRLSKGVHECVLPDGTVVETFKSHKFAFEFLQQQGRPISPEEQALRLKTDVEDLRLKSPTEQIYWLPDYAKRHGIAETKLEQMIEAETKRALAQQRQEQEAARRREQREKEKARQEKVTAKEKRQDDDRQDRKARQDARDQEKARKETERLDRERKKREAVFAEIADLPKLTHEARLKEAAIRLGEDFELLLEEFEVFLAARTIPEDLEPWPEPVNMAKLLGEVETKFCRYVVANKAIVTASVLYSLFTYVVEIARHAPKLVYTFPTRDAGKSVAQEVLRWMVLRPYAAVEATGAAVYRIIDRLRPTLCLDEADTLFARRGSVLAHILNNCWSNNKRMIPRAGSRGKSVDEYDVYGAQIISMRGLNMPDTTQSRSIICLIWPKLPTEVVEEFTYQDDDEFKAIRRKLLRFAIDNAATLRDAEPQFPPGFNNRIRTNWKMLRAIAELAGGEWPKRVRKAALELEADRDEPSEDIRLFQAVKGVWDRAEKERTSESLCAALAAHPSGEWVDITPHKFAAKVRPYGIKPIHGLHPTGRSDLTRGGYRYAQFENVWARLLQKPSRDSHTRTPSGRRRRKT